MSPRRVLLLAGTAEGAGLAQALAGREDVDLIVSLAGRTRAPALLPGRLRVGGFGGVSGLIDFMRRESVDAMIDATHPFAARIAANAAEAARRIGRPHVKLLRPAWRREQGDLWLTAADAASAAELCHAVEDPVFLGIGRQELAPFLALAARRWIVRSVDPEPGLAARPGVETLIARGPFSLDDELRLFRTMGVRAVVSKLSGGDATYAKIAAARALHLPVIMIERPPPPPGAEQVGTIAAALDWYDRLP